MEWILVPLTPMKVIIHLLLGQGGKASDHLKKAKFFSLLLDGSTDKGNIDNELVLVVWCEIDGNSVLPRKNGRVVGWGCAHKAHVQNFSHAPLLTTKSLDHLDRT